MLSATQECAEYEKVISRSLGMEQLEPFVPTTIRTSSAAAGQVISFHGASMNDRPYLVAKVGIVFGSPAAVFMTYPRHRESALARLADVFRIGGPEPGVSRLSEGGAQAGKKGREDRDGVGGVRGGSDGFKQQVALTQMEAGKMLANITVTFLIDVPEGTNLDDLYLEIPLGTVVIRRVGEAKPVRDSSVQAYETVSVEQGES